MARPREKMVRRAQDTRADAYSVPEREAEPREAPLCAEYRLHPWLSGGDDLLIVSSQSIHHPGISSFQDTSMHIAKETVFLCTRGALCTAAGRAVAKMKRREMRSPPTWSPTWSARPHGGHRTEGVSGRERGGGGDGRVLCARAAAASIPGAVVLGQDWAGSFPPAGSSRKPRTGFLVPDPVIGWGGRNNEGRASKMGGGM